MGTIDKRKFKQTIYINKDPSNPYKGWTWIEIDHESVKKFEIPSKDPRQSRNYPESFERGKYPNNGNLPSRGRAGAKKFTLNLDGEFVTIGANKSLTIKALISWLRTWVKPPAKLITTGGKVYSLDETKSKKEAHFIYFIFNKDSNAIKIGRAQNVDKRLATLQTSSPAKLVLIKSVQVEGKREACEFEQSLHDEFSEIRLNGEWFKAEDELLKLIENIKAIF